MRKVLGAIIAFAAMPVAASYAADMNMPLKAPPPVAAAFYNWTGFYLGGEVGGGWAQTTTTVVTGGAAFPAGFVQNPVDMSGVLGGFYGGYNYQINQIVVGIDGYYDWAGVSGSGSTVNPANGDIANHSERMRWDSAITGRLGYANNNWLYFIKGGWAWARFSGNTVTTTGGGALVATLTSADTRDGGTIGAGIEYGFAPHWSAKLEYDYVKFRTASFNPTDVTAGGAVSFPTRSATSDLNELKGGIAYRF